MMRVPSALILLGMTAGSGHAMVPQVDPQVSIAKTLKDDADSRWIYGDIARGFAEAKRHKKPLLIVVRCVP